MAAGKSTRNTKVVGIDTTLQRPKVQPPVNLSVTAKKAWMELVDSTPNEQFTESDFPVMSAYCICYAQLMEAEFWLQLEGSVLTDRMGKQYKSPWFQVSQEASSKIAAISIKLRLCPSSRKKNESTKAKPAPGKATTKLGRLIHKDSN